MKILIAKANQDIIKDILIKVEFKESTKNTSTFSLKNNDAFMDLYNEVKRRGYNPFALMSW